MIQISFKSAWKLCLLCLPWKQWQLRDSQHFKSMDWSIKSTPKIKNTSLKRQHRPLTIWHEFNLSWNSAHVIPGQTAHSNCALKMVEDDVTLNVVVPSIWSSTVMSVELIGSGIHWEESLAQLVEERKVSSAWCQYGDLTLISRDETVSSTLDCFYRRKGWKWGWNKGR